MTDLINRLRAAAHDERLSTGAMYAEAADEIERLRTALTRCVTAWESLPSGYYSPHDIAEWIRVPLKRSIDAARAALKEPT
jgi:hypothetical protein